MDIAFITLRPFHSSRREAAKVLRETITKAGLDLGSCAWISLTETQDEASEAGLKVLRAMLPSVWARVRKANPKIVMPLGDEALVALSGGSRVAQTKSRGIWRELAADGGAPLGVLPSLDPDILKADASYCLDFLTDLQKAKRILDGQDPVIQPRYDQYVAVKTQEMFNSLMVRLEREKVVAIDLETTGLDPADDDILSLGISWAPGTACVIDWPGLVRGKRRNFLRLKEALERLDCSFHNATFDAQWLRQRGIGVRVVFDTMLASYLLDERQGIHSLERITIDRYNAPPYETELHKKHKILEESGKGERRTYADVPWDELVPYNGADVDYTLRLTLDLSSEMVADGVREVMDRTLLPAVEHFMWLERSGMLVDLDRFYALGAEWQAGMLDLEAKLKAFTGAEDVDLASPKQLAKYIYDDLKLDQMSGTNQQGFIDQEALLEEIQEVEDPEAQDYWKTASSAIFSKLTPRSTNTYMLWWLAQQHEFPRLLTQYRLLAKKYTTYFQGIKDNLSRDGRLRPRYKLHGTRTGRLSCFGVNIHGIPRKGEVKGVFMADPGYVLVGADYSQAEVRMMAHFAQDDRLIRALTETDIHRAISRDLFNLTDEELDALPKEEYEVKRRAAKTIMFGVMYGRGPRSIAPQLRVSVPEATAYVERLYSMMPGVKRWVIQQHARVHREMEVRSMYGRKRRFPVIMRGEQAGEVQRQAVNMPIQSSVSDLTLSANLRILSRLQSMGIPCLPWPHIHDGFMFQVARDWVDVAAEITRKEMGDVGFETKVPFTCDISVGESWGSLQKVK